MTIVTTRDAYEFRYGNALRGLSISERWWAPAMFVLMALSCFVREQPAPYDYGMLTLIGVFVISGPLLPAKLLWPAISVTLILMGYAIGSFVAVSFDEAFEYIKVSGFLSVGFLVLSALIWRSPERIGAAIIAGVLAASVMTAMLGILGYFSVFVSPEL